MKSTIQKVLGCALVASAITVIGCDQAGENMPKGADAKVVVPADVPKTSEDYAKQQSGRFTGGEMKNPTSGTALHKQMQETTKAEEPK